MRLRIIETIYFIHFHWVLSIILCYTGNIANGCISSPTSEVFTPPLYFPIGLETFSQLVWRSPVGTVSVGLQKGLLGSFWDLNGES